MQLIDRSYLEKFQFVLVFVHEHLLYGSSPDKPLDEWTRVGVEHTVERDVVTFVARLIGRFRHEDGPVKAAALHNQLKRSTEIAQAVLDDTRVGSCVVQRRFRNIEIHLIDGELETIESE